MGIAKRREGREKQTKTRQTKLPKLESRALSIWFAYAFAFALMCQRLCVGVGVRKRNGEWRLGGKTNTLTDKEQFSPLQ
jgi:hypothetical protein